MDHDRLHPRKPAARTANSGVRRAAAAGPDPVLDVGGVDVQLEHPSIAVDHRNGIRQSITGPEVHGFSVSALDGVLMSLDATTAAGGLAARPAHSQPRMIRWWLIVYHVLSSRNRANQPYPVCQGGEVSGSSCQAMPPPARSRSRSRFPALNKLASGQFWRQQIGMGLEWLIGVGQVTFLAPSMVVLRAGDRGPNRFLVRSLQTRWVAI